MDNTKRFDGRSDSYVKGRPAYADELIDRLAVWANLGEGSTVADIGAGTGIFSAQLVRTGAQVIAVEPNEDMREKGEWLAHGPSLIWLGGTAEATGLANASVDLVTAAQAFHWFDGEAFRAECLRVLRDPADVALIWNVRVADAPVNVACEQVFRALCPRFKGFSGGITRHDSRIAKFFDGQYDLWAFDNHLEYGRERFVERCLSGSYAPKLGEENYAAFKTAVEDIFEQHQHDGTIVVPNETLAYVGELNHAER